MATGGAAAGDSQQKELPHNLQDVHLLQLAEHLVDVPELRLLAVHLLVPEHKIRSILRDFPRINEAAYEILAYWRKDQGISHDAYKNLHEALIKSRLNQLAARLREWVKDGGSLSITTTQPQDIAVTQEKVDFAGIQEQVKDHLRVELEYYLSTDWLTSDEGHEMNLMEIYTDLRWSIKVKKGINDSWESKSSIFDILPSKQDKPKKILVEAIAGMGKTSTMAYLTMKWVENSEKVPFQLVFLIPLRNVDADIPLAELIKTNHGLEDYPTEHVEAILKGKSNLKVLLILDGYDEYTRGTNKAVDEAIERNVNPFTLLITSRPGKDPQDETYIKKKVRSKMSTQVMIEGFTDENIKKCSKLFLDSKEQSDAMLNQVKQKSTRNQWGEYTGLWELLRTPITLLMICVLFKEEQSLPETKTKIYEQIRTLSMNRTTIKKLDKETEEIDNLEELLNWLGEFAWEVLQNDYQQLLLKKKDIENKDPDILKLGLLHEAGGSESATIKKKQIFVSFQHKTIQEFSAADFITKSVEKSPNPEATLKEFFPSIEVVEKQREVVQFCAGLMSDPTPLFNHLCSLHLEEVKSGKNPYVDKDLLNEMYRESQVELPGTEPHHPLYCYVWKRLLQQLSHCTELTKLDLSGSILSRNTLTGLLPEFTPDTPLHSLEVLGLDRTKLNRHDIRHLSSLTNKLPALKKLDLSENTLTGLLPELFTPDTPLHSLEELWLKRTGLNREDVLHVAHLIRTNKLPALKKLYLSKNNLCNMEDEAGELIEACVTHHQRELNEKRDLELVLYGNNVSKEFKEKWERHCEGTNIELSI